MKKAFFAGTVALFLAALANAQQQNPATPGTRAQENAAAGADCKDLPQIANRLDSANKRLQDWAQLDRYREPNAQLPAPAKGEDRVVFMGDSITDGWSNPQFGGFFPGKPYVNRGISGQATPQMLVRFRPDVIALQPRVVVILAGTNDLAGNTGPISVEETEGNLASMAELAKAHGLRVVLSSVMPVSDVIVNPRGGTFLQTARRPPEKILAVNQWIKKYADEHGYVYLDYFSAMVDDKGAFKSELTYDGLHPNAQGYAVMAPLAEKSIDQALQQKSQ
jgi:lysophospholipase L1-like esterase